MSTGDKIKERNVQRLRLAHHCSEETSGVRSSFSKNLVELRSWVVAADAGASSLRN